MIYQNDQYYLQIEIKQNGTPVASSDCHEMIIKVGNIVKKKSTNELVYNTLNQCWLYPLTYEQTSNVGSFNGNVSVQAWFSTTDETKYFDTNVDTLKVGTSIINEEDLEDIINGE